jgi:hypothetical protein
MNGSLTIIDVAFKPWILFHMYPLQTSSFECIRFESDGRIRLYDWVDGDLEMYLVRHDVLQLEDCDYPTACGDYGICSRG